ncbi:MAG: hypothetical protein ACI81T_000518 [Bacteroidia bacterium]
MQLATKMNNQLVQKAKELELIESEFEWLIKNDRKNWVKVAKLLCKVEQGKLYEIKTNSFTQYVLGLAKSNHINASTLWRAKSASAVFMEIVGLENVEDIDASQIKTTPEQLELYGKVRTIAPERIVLELKEKMMRGEGIRNELKALWKTYRPLKHGKTERGRKRKVEKEYLVDADEASQFNLPFSLTEQEINFAIQDDSFAELKLDSEKRRKYLTSPQEVLHANIANALRSPTWFEYTLRQTFVARHQVFKGVIPGKLAGEKLTEQGNKVDVVGFVRPRNEDEADDSQTKDAVKSKLEKPLIFGASIRTNLASFESNIAPLENAEFCNYYYIAIPLKNDFVDLALKKVPRSIGILGINEDVENTKHRTKIVRRARLHEVACKQKARMMTELLLVGLGW